MVNFEHQQRHFRPGNVEEGPFEEIVLTVDELEAMRLSFLENLSQTGAAACMDVHQSTFQRTLRRALEKVTDALVHGKAIRIEGGDYRMPRGDGTGPSGQGQVGGGRSRGQGKGRGDGSADLKETAYVLPVGMKLPILRESAAAR